jgi:hypothetical protein
MQDGCKVLHGIKWILFHGHLDNFQKSPLGGGLTPNRKTMALERSQQLVYFIFIMCEDLRE